MVKNDLDNRKTILIGKATESEIYNNVFPYTKHKFDFIQTERLLKILNDTTSYAWGEIGTPYYDKTIIFYDNNGDTVGYTVISFDGQVDIFPDRALTKWGLLSNKGYKDLMVAIRTE